MRVWDVGTSLTPTIGMPSTVSTTGDVHHAGPLQFWLLALPARLIRVATGSPASVIVAQAAVNALFLTLAIWSVWRCTRSLAAMWAASTTLTVAIWSAGADIGFDIYNPKFAFVAISTASVAAAGLLVRSDTTAALLVVVAASASAQAHLAYAIPSAVVFAVAMAGWLRPTLPSTRDRIAVVAALLVVWSGPLLNAVLGMGGNLRRYLTVDGSVPAAGLGRAMNRLVRSLTPFDLTLHRGAYRPFELIESATAFQWVWASLLIGAVIAATRVDRLRRFALSALAVVAACVVSFAVTPFGVAAIFAPYLVWVWTVPAFAVWGVAVAVVWHVVSVRWPAAWSPFAAVGLGLGTLSLAYLPVLTASEEDLVGNRDCHAAVRALSDAAPRGDFVLDIDGVDADALGFDAFVAVGMYADMVGRGDNGRLLNGPTAAYFHPARTAPPADDEGWHRLRLSPAERPRPDGTRELAVVSGGTCRAEDAPVADVVLSSAGGP